MAASAVLHRSFATDLPIVVGGEGAWLIDQAGRRYLDASGGAAVSCLGHSHPAVIAAVQYQVAQLAFAHTSFFTNAPAERLASRLIGLAPQGFGAGRVAFVGSGSEAMEVALKLARQYQVPLVPFLLADVALDPALMQDDGLHPVAAGEPRVLDTVWPYLVPLLRH